MAFISSFTFPSLAPSALDPAWFAQVENEDCDALALQEEAYEAERVVAAQPRDLANATLPTPPPRNPTPPTDDEADKPLTRDELREARMAYFLNSALK